MDLAYDHVQESTLPTHDDKKKDGSKDPKNDQPQASLNEDLQEAYKALSTSAWGMRIGGFLGNAVKQGQSVYKEASKEVTELGGDAAKGFTSIINRTRSLTINTTEGEASGDKGKETDETTPTKTRGQASDEAMSNSENYMTKIRAEAARRLKELQKAEDAADEALLRFGTNISNFLKEAVSIAPPSDSNNQGRTVLFESKDAQGKRVIHTSRQDAQLHVIHTSTESFTKDPATEEFATWGKTFDVEKKTEDISNDLKQYPELRTTMEKLVPDQVPYAEFWKRYYFLRHGIEAAEARRRDLLKAASAEDEVSWDDDSSESSEEESSEEDSDDEAAPATASKTEQKKPVRPPSTESSTTIQPPVQASQTTLKPAESRKSNDEKSQPDSDTSYDVVGDKSGVPSRAPNSPKGREKADDSDDEDWE
ncbi:BSD domain-containing protein [Colletotrichum karsti]|uniref:BSD domain-containing protein n=1 Tax=Colletotrichum karsti TaxID=1095194 RepID=A0A9P6I5S7_9PEZI|nr:BSD domain-containing protein [Colletotrichum karsti]KAF9876262.1 BSD domain-containing protein [Colletotrichum karsti]